MKDGWKYKKLGDLFPYIKNGANIKQSREAKGYPITRIETLSGGVFNRDRLGYANIYEIDKYENYVLQSHDLLLSHINSKIYIGRTVEYKAEEGETIIHGMNLLRLKSNQKVINSSFFAYYALSTKFKDDIAKIRKDAVNQSSVAISDLKCIRLPLPPLPEQQSIVAELDKINEIIDLKKTQLKDLDLLAQSIFYNMFGDPIENPKGWEVKKLGEIASFKNGLNFAKNENGVIYKFLGVSDFKLNNEISSKELSTISLDSELNKDYLLKDNDIVFVRSNGSKELVGRCVLVKVNEETTYSGFCIRCRIIYDEIIPTYLLTVLKSNGMRAYLTQSGQGCNISNLNQKILAKADIPLPPLSLQQSFAEKIQAIESQKSAIKQSLTEVETLLASRMDYYFN